jgi:hypothetical protein
VAVVRHVLGLDLGQAAESTGLAVVEQTVTDGSRRYAVRHLKRFTPGTAFVAVAAAVGAAVRDGGLGRPVVVADLTAVGPGVLPVLRRGASTRVVAAVVTAGLAAVEADGVWQVPKRDLVTGLQLLLQGRRLQVARDLPEAELLARELAAFRARPTLTPDPLTADWRERPHDDLVLAVALACWWAERHPPHGPGAFATGGSTLAHELERLFPAPPEPPGW